jgi:hypothetical protein
MTMIDDDDDPDLFDLRGYARTSDPPTSFETAEEILRHIRELQHLVYDRILAAGPVGITSWEIEEYFGDHGSTYRSRISELRDDFNLVCDSGRRKLIRTPGKTKATNRVVWIATKFKDKT